MVRRVNKNRWFGAQRIKTDNSKKLGGVVTLNAKKEVSKNIARAAKRLVEGKSHMGPGGSIVFISRKKKRDRIAKAISLRERRDRDVVLASFHDSSKSRIKGKLLED